MARPSQSEVAWRRLESGRPYRQRPEATATGLCSHICVPTICARVSRYFSNVIFVNASAPPALSLAK